MAGSSDRRAPVREVLPKLYLGRYPPGRLNSLTDVPGVLVSTQSLHAGPSSTHSTINTGVTTILPRASWFDDACHAAIHSFNGSGEVTGSHWIAETGLLNSPIIISNSFAVGSCYNGVYEYALKHHRDAHGLADWFLLPVIAETYDGILNDIGAMAVKPEHVVQGIESASAEKVAQGNTGGGTGMLMTGQKGGTGSASRVLRGTVASVGEETQAKQYTIAALVQSNFGKRHFMRIGGIPVGRMLEEQNMPGYEERAEGEAATAKKDGSIIVVIATDAPLLPTQLQRLAKRAIVGLARVGGWGSNQSGDIFIAFSTANKIPRDAGHSWEPKARGGLEVVDDMSIDGLFEACADVVEESIYNALCMAGTMEGPRGFKAHALDLAWLKETIDRVGRYF